MATAWDVLDRIDSLTARMEAQEREIAELKAQGRTTRATTLPGAEPSSRRDLLKLAGAAGIGAAGAALMRSIPAEAADGQNVVLGTTGDAQNHMTTTTTLTAAGNVTPLALATDTVNLASTLNPGLTTVGVSNTSTSGNARGGNGVAATGGSGAGIQGGGDGVLGIGGTSSSAAGGSGVRGIGADGSSGDGGIGVRGGGGSGASGGPGVVGTGGDGLGPNGGTGVVATGGNPSGLGLAASGTGFGAPIFLQPFLGGPAGVPAGGTHAQGELWVDSNGVVYVCVSPGSPGSWVAVQTGGSNDATKNSFFRSVITTQPTLHSSDGATWTDMVGGPTLSITPPFNCTAILSANADLWTDTAGYNQDLGIVVGGGVYPTAVGQPEAWKESGGFAGTYSPNAAFVQTAIPLLAATTYAIKLQWKTNRNAPGATIWAGAGPISGKYSPTSLAAHLVVTP